METPVSRRREKEKVKNGEKKIPPRVLVFGGTTEGKKAAAALDAGKTRYFYSTKTRTDFKPSVFCEYVWGEMDGNTLPEFVKKEKIKLIVNAAHPFARHLHETVSLVSEKMKIPVIRYGRKYPERVSHPSVVYCDNYSGAVNELKNTKGAMIILSGVQTLAALKPLWENRDDCYARILPRKTSVSLAVKQGFPEKRLITAMPSRDAEKEKQFFKKLNIKSVITKESGDTGGQDAKIKAAIETGAKTAIIKKPRSPFFTATVFSPETLTEKIREMRDVS